MFSNIEENIFREASKQTQFMNQYHNMKNRVRIFKKKIF